MIKYYTRACNFYYGQKARANIKKKKAYPLCGNKLIALDKIEIFKKSKKKIYSKTISINSIKNLSNLKRIKVLKDLRKITSKRKNFLKNLDFSNANIMGIVNLTPDSFSDGGKYNSKNKSIDHIKKLITSGANIIDLGGESTRPGAKTLSVQNEWRRLKNSLISFKKKNKSILLSLDTRKPEIMEKSLKYGVDIINDVSGFEFNEFSPKMIKKIKVAKVLHHMQGTPQNMQKNPKYNNVLLDIYDFFENKLKDNSKIKNIILDPGIGFGKKLKHNLTLISKVSLFHSLGLPILVGTSRKRFINEISGKYDSKERIGGTLASVLFLLSQGVQVFRVHNVREVKQGILIFKKILFNQ